MDEANNHSLHQLEGFLGFPIDQKETTLEMNEPHNEAISYALCQRLYGDRDATKKAIALATFSILAAEKSNHSSEARRKLALLYSTLGNLYYLLGDFDKGAHCFMRSLSNNRENLTYWVELMFAIRSLGDFGLFEDMIFNMEKIYTLWKQTTDREMTKEGILGLIKQAKRLS